MLRNKLLDITRRFPLAALLLTLAVVGIAFIWLLSQHELITSLTRLMQSIPLILVFPSLSKRTTRQDQETQMQSQNPETTTKT